MKGTELEVHLVVSAPNPQVRARSASCGSHKQLVLSHLTLNNIKVLIHVTCVIYHWLLVSMVLPHSVGDSANNSPCNTVVFTTEKYLHIRGSSQFKCILFKGQVYFLKC